MFWALAMVSLCTCKKCGVTKHPKVQYTYWTFGCFILQDWQFTNAEL